MTILFSATITAPLTATVTTPISFRKGTPESVVVQSVFTYGSGGTTAKAWVQTSFDGGATWMDIVAFSMTTSSLTNIYTLSALTPKTTAVIPGDGALTANTAVDGMLGALFRVKTTTTGTYGGSTTLRIDMCGRG